MRERIVLRYNLNGEDYVHAVELDELQLMLSERGSYNELKGYTIKRLIQEVATHIVETVGITWVDEIDWQYQMRMSKGTFGDKNRFTTDQRQRY